MADTPNLSKTWSGPLGVEQVEASLQRITRGEPGPDDGAILRAVIARWSERVAGAGRRLGLSKYGNPCPWCGTWTEGFREDEHFASCPKHPGWSRLEMVGLASKLHADFGLPGAHVQVQRPPAPGAAPPPRRAPGGRDSALEDLEVCLAGRHLHNGRSVLISGPELGSAEWRALYRQATAPRPDDRAAMERLAVVVVEWFRLEHPEGAQCPLCAKPIGLLDPAGHMSGCEAHPAQAAFLAARDALLERGPEARAVLEVLEVHRRVLVALRDLSERCEIFDGDLGWDDGPTSNVWSERPWKLCQERAAQVLETLVVPSDHLSALAGFPAAHQVLSGTCVEIERLADAVRTLLHACTDYWRASGDGPNGKSVFAERAQTPWAVARAAARAALEPYQLKTGQGASRRLY